MNPVQHILILLVRLYRVTLSPAKTFLFGSAAQCRFEPSCSQYAIEALKGHGALAGGWLAAKRVCRCHPWGQCGEDPCPKPKVQSPKSKVARWIKSRITQWPTSRTQEFLLPKGEGRGEGKTRSITRRRLVPESMQIGAEFNTRGSEGHI